MAKKTPALPQLYGAHTSFENLELTHEINFAIDVLLNHGDLTALAPQQKEKIEVFLNNVVLNSPFARALLLDQCMQTLNLEHESSTNHDYHSRRKELAVSKKRLDNFNKGFAYVQTKLNLKLTELLDYTDSIYKADQISIRVGISFLDSSHNLSNILHFMGAHFSDQRDTTNFLLSHLNPFKGQGFKIFLGDPDNDAFVKNNFAFTPKEEAMIFSKSFFCHNAFGYTEKNTYEALKNHPFLNRNEHEKSLKNKMIIAYFDEKASENYHTELSEMKDDYNSLKNLANFLTQIKKENTHSQIKCTEIDRVVEYYLERNAMQIMIWQHQCGSSEIESFPKVLKDNEKIEKILGSLVNLFPEAKSVATVKESLPIEFFEGMKSAYRLKKSPETLKKEWIASTPQSILLNHVYKEHYDPSNPRYIEIEKKILQLQMTVKESASQIILNKDMTKPTQPGSYKI